MKILDTLVYVSDEEYIYDIWLDKNYNPRHGTKPTSIVYNIEHVPLSLYKDYENETFPKNMRDIDIGITIKVAGETNIKPNTKYRLVIEEIEEIV
jgi:hypothetical protein